MNDQTDLKKLSLKFILMLFKIRCSGRMTMTSLDEDLNFRVSIVMLPFVHSFQGGDSHTNCSLRDRLVQLCSDDIHLSKDFK